MEEEAEQVASWAAQSLSSEGAASGGDERWKGSSPAATVSAQGGIFGKEEDKEVNIFNNDIVKDLTARKCQIHNGGKMKNNRHCYIF